ncbi:hypothetical protein [Vibrio spartinae]|uniref:Uncharacterized protein n=1 Tax=Vibrio spartinae TaxID=1918945 RepID=A0ABX6R2V2_9VIBR|nr:hypothetical protein [Vibrio spartinae]QMV15492.1 hypothetical protein Vspart_02812 [Vibrio spartinae]
MIHVGGYYEVFGRNHLGGSYGCFGFIPEDDIYSSPDEAQKAEQADNYDDNFSNEPWKQIADKIINLAFPDKKPIQILLDYRDESKNRVPTKIFEEF